MGHKERQNEFQTTTSNNKQQQQQQQQRQQQHKMCSDFRPASTARNLNKSMKSCQ
jgi:hypothetical protein